MNYLLLCKKLRSKTYFPALDRHLLSRKTTFLALLIFVAVAHAHSMVQKVTLSFENVKIDQVFTEITKQTNYRFLYPDDVLKNSAKISIKVKNADLNEVLNQIIDPQTMTYKVIAQTITINVAQQKEPVQQRMVSPFLPIANQEINVKGKVTDEDGLPLPGASVKVKGISGNGISTNADGAFTLIVPNANAILVVSYIGHIAQEVPLNGNKSIVIRLQSENANLDEVVVVGYGTQRKKDLTGSVGSVSSTQIQDLAIPRIDQALSGKVAGVQVKAATGEPGAPPQIRVRGIGSISAGVTPLYVVDGFPTDNITTINPNDIESLDILKDASATAIYGSRGSNGVIIINTKRGKTGKTMLNFDTYYGFQNVLKKPKMKNSMEQAKFFFDGVRNANLDKGNDISGDPTQWKSAVPQIIMDVLNGVNTTDEDALDGILRTAPQRQHQLSVSGGSENVKFLVSGEYLKQDGIVVNSDFERYSMRSNLDAKISKKLSVKVNLNPSFTNKKALPSTGVCCLTSGVVAAAMNIPNFRPLIGPNGEYTNYDGLADMAAVYNPLAIAHDTQVAQRQMRLLGNISASYQLSEDFSFNVLLGGSVTNDKGFIFKPSKSYFFNEPATGADDAALTVNWLNEYLLNYNKTFNGVHNLSAMAGYTVQREWGESNTLTSNRYPNNLVPTLNAVSGLLTDGESLRYDWSILSYLGRVNYNYSEKYYVTASLRTDGSSRFGSNNKYGVFPSFALAWRISEENFLKESFLSDWKLRASYGETGNNNIGNYAHLATINYEKYALGGQAVGGFSVNNLANPNLTWEKQKSINFGTDISLLKSRLNVNIDYFRSQNTNLLLNVSVPGISGFSTALQNIGKIQNTGWEFVLSSQNFIGNFQWSTDFNFSTYDNKVVELGPGGDPIYSGNNVTMIGQPIGMFYGLLTDGVFMNQQELDKGPKFNQGGADASRVGDIRFVDINGDGIINSSDYTIMGSPYPNFYYGMTNNFAYHNVSLSIGIQGSQGGEIYNMSRDGGNSGRARVRGYAFSNEYWKSEAEPGDGKTPRPNDVPTGGRRLPSQSLLDEASFLRINNITLGYTFSKSIADKIRANAFRIYLSATNPVIFTKNTAFNPDVSMNDNPLQPGIESNNYPIPKSFILGLNLTF